MVGNIGDFLSTLPGESIGLSINEKSDPSGFVGDSLGVEVGVVDSVRVVEDHPLSLQRHGLDVVQSHTVECEGTWAQTGWHALVEVGITGTSGIKIQYVVKAYVLGNEKRESKTSQILNMSESYCYLLLYQEERKA